MKVAINRCYGGFSPSDALFKLLISKGWTLTTYDEDGYCEDPNASIVDSGDCSYGFSRYSFVGDREAIKLRTHPDIIEAIEILGEAASGRCGNLQIFEVPDGVDIEIKDYDGFEHIAEVHRTWG
ncbi:hypothetical protein NQ117_05575 [Paenibacillus sp. SC116]|uniref:hypothetical protein n=1 Tax=Paenibacillus sp. SC116 TaxID=2968986 RepID=UPI00215B0482|nr:hypothetical protein [Paenibacillus sp. SC116]MCR8843143.1 hypothetical protein [Paenibacillus sp. SC116]